MDVSGAEVPRVEMMEKGSWMKVVAWLSTLPEMKETRNTVMNCAHARGSSQNRLQRTHACKHAILAATGALCWESLRLRMQAVARMLQGHAWFADSSACVHVASKKAQGLFREGAEKHSTLHVHAAEQGSACARLEDVVLVDDGEVDERLRVQALQAPQDGQQVGQQRQEDLQHQACRGKAAKVSS